MSIYLSIDMDYWADPKEAARFLTRALALDVPSVLAVHHHHLMPHVRAFPADTLINVDYHDDLTSLSRDYTTPEEGSWASFVPWNRKARYDWRFPPRGGHNCDFDELPLSGSGPVTPWEQFTYHRANRKHSRRWGRWHDLSCREGTEDIEWDRVIAVGVCISPKYLEYHDPYLVWRWVDPPLTPRWLHAVAHCAYQSEYPELPCTPWPDHDRVYLPLARHPKRSKLYPRLLNLQCQSLYSGPYLAPLDRPLC